MSKDEQVIGSEDVTTSGENRTSIEGGKESNFETRKEAEKKVNPSSPGETGTTPGSNSK